MRCSKIGLKKQQSIQNSISLSILKRAIKEDNMKTATDMAIKLKMLPKDLVDFINKEEAK